MVLVTDCNYSVSHFTRRLFLRRRQISRWSLWLLVDLQSGSLEVSWRNGGTLSRREQFRFASRELISAFRTPVNISRREETYATRFSLWHLMTNATTPEIFFVSTFLFVISLWISRFIVIIYYRSLFDEKIF